MATKPLLMGAEVEYSMSTPPPVTKSARTEFHRQILDAVRGEHPWLPDVRTPSGIYIDNGSRYYLDSGEHNEFSSPELSTPRQVAVYDRANEQILQKAQAALKADGNQICITKNNVNFSMPDRAAWGQHEAYTCWVPLEQAAEQLIPHMVSRIPYAGAGMLSAHPDGMGFELSQRARHMTRPTGAETTRDRAIFCTRAFKGRDMTDAGWTRTNLISKDSQRCSFGMYLTYGVTGLLFMIINEGHKIGGDVRLKDPTVAMRSISLDPWLKTRVKLANGKLASAIDIQRAYLRDAQPHVERGRLPDWTHEVFERWSTTLDQLEDNPFHLANRLDTYLKLSIFDHQLRRAGMSWKVLHRALQILDQVRRAVPESIVRAVLNDNRRGLSGDHLAAYERLAGDQDLKRIGIEPLRFVVRLQALELNYHELGGLFDQLSATGHVDPVVVTAREVEHAIHHAPAGGRAEARSKSIAELQGQPWICDWQYIVNHAENKWIDLRDPFAERYHLTSIPSGFPRGRSMLDMADLLASVGE